MGETFAFLQSAGITPCSNDALKMSASGFAPYRQWSEVALGGYRLDLVTCLSSDSCLKYFMKCFNLFLCPDFLLCWFLFQLNEIALITSNFSYRQVFNTNQY